MFVLAFKMFFLNKMTTEVYSDDEQGRSTKIVNFMTPGQESCHISHITKMHYFFKHHFL